LQLNQRASEWRNAFGATAINIVSDTFNNHKAFDVKAGEKTTREAKIAARVKYLLGNDLPWLWENGFEPPKAGMVCDSYYAPPPQQTITHHQTLKKSGYYRSPLILETFAIHFGVKYGVDVDPVLIESYPAGALILAITAVSELVCLLTIDKLIPYQG
jgi:hypothetical protein